MLVSVDHDGSVVGYASFADWRMWDGYRHTVEHAAYVREDQHERGIDRDLWMALIERASLTGKRVIVAVGGARSTHGDLITNPSTFALQMEITVARPHLPPVHPRTVSDAGRSGEIGCVVMSDTDILNMILRLLDDNGARYEKLSHEALGFTSDEVAKARGVALGHCSKAVMLKVKGIKPSVLVALTSCVPGRSPLSASTLT